MSKSRNTLQILPIVARDRESLAMRMLHRLTLRTVALTITLVVWAASNTVTFPLEHWLWTNAPGFKYVTTHYVERGE